MQKTKIEWCDMTWNPVTGCLHGCEYCYARRIAERFGGWTMCGAKVTFGIEGKDTIHELKQPKLVTRKNHKVYTAPFPYGFDPTLHRYRLDEPQKIKKPQTVFVCSMADLFGEWVPDDWIYRVFEACKAAPQHRYIFLTKNPKRYAELDLPRSNRFWFGWSVTEGYSKNFAPLYTGVDSPGFFVSCEPLLGKIDLDQSVVGGFEWVIIGAMTGPGAEKHKLKKEWVDGLCYDAWVNKAPVFMKDSLIPIIGEDNMRREFPWT